mmetsp:Transcript_83740/g.148141  ORF Transcript_83740/g.148141 Transcript_83740/m.148141 type:complete len:155 (+) Transcript_83740:141-605(+)
MKVWLAFGLAILQSFAHNCELPAELLEDLSDPGLQLLQVRAGPGCPSNALIGTWEMHDALGVKGITVTLTIETAAASTAKCGPLRGYLEYIGKRDEYKIDVKELAGGKLHLTYSNEKAAIPYSHEGVFDSETGLLTEDLGGFHQNAALTFTRKT